jgi:hypothetical protein
MRTYFRTTALFTTALSLSMFTDACTYFAFFAIILSLLMNAKTRTIALFTTAF